MYFRTTCDWDEGFWDALEGVYKQAFINGRKNRHIVKKLLNQGQGCLHVGIEGSGGHCNGTYRESGGFKRVTN